jgi:hypothetical protein
MLHTTIGSADGGATTNEYVAGKEYEFDESTTDLPKELIRSGAAVDVAGKFTEWLDRPGHHPNPNKRTQEEIKSEPKRDDSKTENKMAEPFKNK